MSLKIFYITYSSLGENVSCLLTIFVCGILAPLHICGVGQSNLWIVIQGVSIRIWKAWTYFAFRVWNFQDFSTLQVLCEFNFGIFRSFKATIFAILGALNFVNLVNFSLSNEQKLIKSKFRASKCAKMTNFPRLEHPKLVSCKILVLEKIWNCYTGYWNICVIHHTL